IFAIESMLRNAIIIEETAGTSDIVTLGKTVTFIELPDGEEEEYTIVGSAEADPFEGRISNDSPIAKALLGRKVDDIVKLTTPGGDMEVRIVSISAAK